MLTSPWVHVGCPSVLHRGSVSFYCSRENPVSSFSVNLPASSTRLDTPWKKCSSCLIHSFGPLIRTMSGIKQVISSIFKRKKSWLHFQKEIFPGYSDDRYKGHGCSCFQKVFQNDQTSACKVYWWQTRTIKEFLKSILNHHLLWMKLFPHSCIKALTPTMSECHCIWRYGLWRGN